MSNNNESNENYTHRVSGHYARNYKNPVKLKQCLKNKEQNKLGANAVDDDDDHKAYARQHRNYQKNDDIGDALLIAKENEGQVVIEPPPPNETDTITVNIATTTTSSVLQSVPGAIHFDGPLSSITTARIIDEATTQKPEALPIASATVVARDFHEGDYSRIEISIKCRDLKNTDWLSKSDPFCVVHLASEGGAHFIDCNNNSSGNGGYYNDDDDEYAQIYKIPPEGSRELGRTEVIKDNLNPNFTKTFTTNFIFEEKQTLIIRVYDEDVENDDDLSKHDYIGYAIVTLGKLMSSRGHQIKLPLLKSTSKNKKKKRISSGRRRGYVILQAEKMTSCNDQLILTIAASDLSNVSNGSSPRSLHIIKSLFSSASNDRPRPFLLLSRKNPSGNYTAVWKSHVIENKDIIPAWSTHMTLQRICNGDLDRPICFEIFDWAKNGSHKIMGCAHTTVRQLLTLPTLNIKDNNTSSSCSNNNDSYSYAGKLKIKRADLLEIPSMLEYTSGTCRINFMAAVDFSSSNNFILKHVGVGGCSDNTPSSDIKISDYASSLKYLFKLPSESLHFFNDCGFPNEYQAALSNIGSILREYGTNCQTFPLYGFGANISGDGNENSNCFKVPSAAAAAVVNNADNSDDTGDEYNDNDALNSMLDDYRDVFRDPSFEMTEPTLLAPIIREAAKNARKLTAENDQAYTCCLILTDGQIDDIDQTIDTLVEVAASSPLSIIIVGVGDGDFSDMMRLDGDDEAEGRLVSSTREVCARDLVQFVPFRKYSKTMSHLTAETLAEVPYQLVNYFMSKGMKPSPEVPIADVTY